MFCTPWFSTVFVFFEVQNMAAIKFKKYIWKCKIVFRHLSKYTTIEVYE